MMHLTFTGVYAGLPICGADRAAEAERGARFAHYAYCGDLSERLDVCSDCLEIVRESEED